MCYSQRPRTSSAATGGKLSVPKPVNLPSIKKVRRNCEAAFPRPQPLHAAAYAAQLVRRRSLHFRSCFCAASSSIGRTVAFTSHVPAQLHFKPICRRSPTQYAAVVLCGTCENGLLPINTIYKHVRCRCQCLQEHGGNDPTTQVVPSNGTGWSKHEDAPSTSPERSASSLTSGSHWAASGAPPPRAGPGAPAPWNPPTQGPPPHAYGPPFRCGPLPCCLFPVLCPGWAANATLSVPFAYALERCCLVVDNHTNAS